MNIPKIIKNIEPENVSNKDFLNEEAVIDLPVMHNFPNPADRPTPHKQLEPENTQNIINITPQEKATILGTPAIPTSSPELNKSNSFEALSHEAHQRSNRFLEERLKKRLEDKKC